MAAAVVQHEQQVSLGQSLADGDAANGVALELRQAGGGGDPEAAIGVLAQERTRVAVARPRP